jgi:pimeloyl-ACP methyl ester carboxylesterase
MSERSVKKLLRTCLGVVGLVVAIARQVPAGPLLPDPVLRSFVLGDERLMRPGVLGSVPEIDVVKLGTALFTRLIPGISAKHAQRIRRETLRLYREVNDRGDVPSVYHLGGLELLGRRFDAGNYFAYVPASDPCKRLGAIVFLHGNGGNFTIMPWVWRAFAETHRYAIIAPTYGFGFWGEGGVEAVERVVDDALIRLPIDPKRLYLAGLSDGGNGVTRSGRAHPDRYQGLIYVSPTMRLDEVGSPAFVAGWKGRPVLVIQGDADRNVRKADVDPAVASLVKSGVGVTYRVFAGEDHFLFLGRSDEVFRVIADWIETDTTRVRVDSVPRIR